MDDGEDGFKDVLEKLRDKMHEMKLNYNQEDGRQTIKKVNLCMDDLNKICEMANSFRLYLNRSLNGT